MTTFEEEELEKLMKLCRIRCTEKEKKKLHGNLGRILAYISQLQEVNTEGVPPCCHVNESLENTWREDEVKDLLSRDLFLANAPEHVGGMVRVPPVIKF